MATTEMLCFKVYTKGDFFFRIYIESGYIRRFGRINADLWIRPEILNPKSNLNLNLMIPFKIAIFYFISFAKKKIKKTYNFIKLKKGVGRDTETAEAN